MTHTPKSVAERLQRIRHESAARAHPLHGRFLQLRRATLEQMGRLIEEQIAAQGAPALPPAPAPGRLPVFTAQDLAEFASGSISRCFGAEFARFEGRRHPRIPNGDLLLMSRVVEIDGLRGGFERPAGIVTEYDVPADAWFFAGQNTAGLPYSLWMELALQPCGFLSAYLGTMLLFPEVDYYFRNLDGHARMLRVVDVRGKTITCAARLLSTVTSGSTIIQKFSFRLSCMGEPVFEGESIFGFFPPEGMANQVGLDAGKVTRPAVEEAIGLAGEWADLTAPGGYFDAPAGKPFYRLAGGRMHFLDRVFIAPASGYIAGVRANDPQAWFYACHFYQDPVMPGSLGVEAILEALQVYALHSGLGEGFRSPCFAPVLGHPLAWKYRGQILPSHRQMKIEARITGVERPAGEVILTADASLWADAVRIYEVKGAALRIIEAE